MHSSGTSLEWSLFALVVAGMLALDLLVFRSHPENKGKAFRQGVVWSIVWIALALLFNGFILLNDGAEPALNFFTAYIVEKSLSVDNLFVFLAIFNYFSVPEKHQHRVLFWGILSALILRGAFILGGTALLSAFHWMFYVFGAFLIYTGIKLIARKDVEVDPEKNPAIRLARRYLPLEPQLQGDRFFVVRNGRWLATPLVIVLISVEFTDILFAVDSVPAVLGISDDLFIVYTSNIFAILGLRALYFVIAGMLVRIQYLDYGLAAVLSFIGVKMILSDLVHVPVFLSLCIIALLLGLAVVASFLHVNRAAQQRSSRGPEERD